MKQETKNLRHDFTTEELAGLHKEFHQATKNVAVIESEFDSVKASYKARQTEAEATAARLSSSIDAGFEMRLTKCVIVFRNKDSKKDYYPESVLIEDENADGGYRIPEGVLPSLTEDMTPEDFQTDLLEAEAKFEKREEIELFGRTEKDFGTLVVGRQKGRWFAALRVSVGGRKIEERLDSEQPCCKNRYDAITKATKRFDKWVNDSLGKEVAKGFKESLYNVCEAHKEREE